MRPICYPVSLAATILTLLAVEAQAAGTASNAPVASTEQHSAWHARLGLSLNPPISTNDGLPSAHLGFGAAVSGFYQFTRLFSAGLAVEWDRYTFDSQNSGDPPGAAARYTDEVLTQTRVMALFQWDVIRRRFITPFVVGGLGYGWQDANLTEWQCSPALAHGLTLGTGAGVDFAVHELVGIGVEYRINTLPFAPRTCTLAQKDNEPKGPPQDLLWQRIAVTVSMRR